MSWTDDNFANVATAGDDRAGTLVFKSYGTNYYSDFDTMAGTGGAFLILTANELDWSQNAGYAWTIGYCQNNFNTVYIGACPIAWDATPPRSTNNAYVNVLGDGAFGNGLALGWADMFLSASYLDTTALYTNVFHNNGTLSSGLGECWQL